LAGTLKTRRRTTAAAKPRRRVRRVRRPPLTWADRRLTPALVDRLFWRAGFGPSEADRARWTGKRLRQAVDWMLTASPVLVGPPPVNGTAPLNPVASDTDLVLEWLDRMVRSDNPLPERLTFFWHNHFATSRNDVSSQMIRKQIALLRSFSDLGANPSADFRSLIQAVTVDPAMLRSLTGEANVKGRPNENYAREVMELFCLGVTDASGVPNYSEDDVRELARALSGWQINNSNPDNPFGFFNPNRWDSSAKTVLGRTGHFDTPQAIDVVLSHPNHPAHVVRKLWNEFVVSPPDAGTLNDLAQTYVRRGRRLRPVLRKILLHRALYDSPSEPNMIKAPIVYVAGAMRAMGMFVVDSGPRSRLQAMGQEPYFPPDVSGWEYGPAWLNSNTAISRFRLVADYWTSTSGRGRIDATDIPGETAQQAFDRAYAAVGRPWMSPDTRARVLDYANRAAGASLTQRRTRQSVLRALILGGPDGQVM
jgi:uncharacterized protein (DUF1800 family)